VAPAPIDGMSVCRMFKRAAAAQPLPKYVSTDHDPLFRFHRWLANLRVLDIKEIKSVPYAPISHLFVERLIGTIRREVFDQMFFWNALDLTRRLAAFRCYYNEQRVHRSLAVQHRPNGPAHQRRPLRRSISMAGGSTVVAYFRSQCPLVCQFATHTFRLVSLSRLGGRNQGGFVRSTEQLRTT
jgi:hypothetical protein